MARSKGGAVRGLNTTSLQPLSLTSPGSTSALLLFPASDIIISAPGVGWYYGLECVTLT